MIYEKLTTEIILKSKTIPDVKSFQKNPVFGCEFVQVYQVHFNTLTINLQKHAKRNKSNNISQSFMDMDTVPKPEKHENSVMCVNP